MSQKPVSRQVYTNSSSSPQSTVIATAAHHQQVQQKSRRGASTNANHYAMAGISPDQAATFSLGLLKGKLQNVATSVERQQRQQAYASRGKVGSKDPEHILKSHSSIIAETAMINNHRTANGSSATAKPRTMISGLISQLNSSAEQLQQRQQKQLQQQASLANQNRLMQSARLVEALQSKDSSNPSAVTTGSFISAGNPTNIARSNSRPVAKPGSSRRKTAAATSVERNTRTAATNGSRGANQSVDSYAGAANNIRNYQIGVSIPGNANGSRHNAPQSQWQQQLQPRGVTLNSTQPAQLHPAAEQYYNMNNHRQPIAKNLVQFKKIFQVNNSIPKPESTTFIDDDISVTDLVNDIRDMSEANDDESQATMMIFNEVDRPRHKHNESSLSSTRGVGQRNSAFNNNYNNGPHSFDNMMQKSTPTIIQLNQHTTTNKDKNNIGIKNNDKHHTRAKRHEQQQLYIRRGVTQYHREDEDEDDEDDDDDEGNVHQGVADEEIRDDDSDIGDNNDDNCSSNIDQISQHDHASSGNMEEDNAVISDRCLMDSALSQQRVNVPLNSLPKLSRHRKSDLLATELEGNPQKPSGISVHFSKRRIANGEQQQVVQLQRNTNQMMEHQGKVEDSGVTKSKVNSINRETDILLTVMSTGGNNNHVKTNSMSEGSMQIANKMNQNRDKSIAFNRGMNTLMMMEQDSTRLQKAPRGVKSREQLFQKPLKGIQPNQMTRATPVGELNQYNQQSDMSQRSPQVITENNLNLRQNQIKQYFGAEKPYGDVLCLEDLLTNTDPPQPVVTESPFNVKELASYEDENVGDTTPNRQKRITLTASENLSQSQYLSSSFQNTKRSSQLKQILTMSLTNSQGISNGTQTLIRKLEGTKKHPQPQLMSTANRKKEKTGLNGKPTAAAAVGATTTKFTNTHISSPSKASRITAKYSPKKQKKHEGKSGDLNHQNIDHNDDDSGLEANLQLQDGSSAGGKQSRSSPHHQQTVILKRVPFKKPRKNEPNTMSVKHGMEPMRLMKTASVDQQTIQRVKKSQANEAVVDGHVKRGRFQDGDGHGKATSGSSFIRDEEAHNSFTNNRRTRVAGSKLSDDEQVIEIDVIKHFSKSNYQSRPQLNNNNNNNNGARVNTQMIEPHISHGALQRGLSPPANVKELSSDSRSSANIIEHQSPTAAEVTQKSMNSSHYQLTKYNRSAYKLKQYISDVNKIQMRQSELLNNVAKQNQQNPQKSNKHHAMASGKKKQQLQSGGGAVGGSNKNGHSANTTTTAAQAHQMQIKAKQLHISTEKRRAIANSSPHTAGYLMNKQQLLKTQSQNNQSQLTTQNTTQQHVLLRSQRSAYQMNHQQRSVSPQQETSLSRMLSYCPNISSNNRASNPPVLRNAMISLAASSNSNEQLRYYSGQAGQITAIRPRKQPHSLSLILPRVFRSLIGFLDYMSLFTFMQTRKDYRWDVVSTRGKGYQPDYYWVHKELRKRMKQILLKDGGLRSTVERRNFWIYRSKLNRIKDSFPTDLYNKLVAKHFKDSMVERPSFSEIGKDIGRTFPDLQFFQKEQPGQLKLHKILTALSMFQEQKEAEPLGYTQGMNFIAGTALVHLQQHDENTFWFLISLLCKHKFRQVFNFLSEGTFRVLCFQLEVLTQVYLPELHEHLTKNKVPTDIYASNWFITMFTNDLPFDMAASVLDVYLLEGHKGLLRIALSILSFLKTQLIGLPYDELMVFLSHPNAREASFRELDQYWLFQTSFTFKITKSLLEELHRLFIVREKLSTLKSADNQQEAADVSEDDCDVAELSKELKDYITSLKYFKNLQLYVDQSTVGFKQHSWHLLMLSPDDVDQLMTGEEALKTDEIEQLRQFYNTRIKEKSLGTVLTTIEAAIKDHEELLAASQEEIVEQPAQENSILRATKIMPTQKFSTNLTLNSEAIHRRTFHLPIRDVPARPISKASSLSPEITLRSSQRVSERRPMKKNSDVPAKKPDNPDVPEEVSDLVMTDDLFSNILSPKSATSGQRLINLGTFRGSMASTPRIQNSMALGRPFRQRNFEDSQKHSSLNLPYGEPTIKMAQKQGHEGDHLQQQSSSIFDNWAFELGSKLENLFKPAMSLSPQNARIQPIRDQQQMTYGGLYDSNKMFVKARSPQNHQNLHYHQHKKNNSSHHEFNLSNQSKSVANVYGGDSGNNINKSSPEMQITGLQMNQKGKKNMTPHKMLTGDDQILINASSSFDFSKVAQQQMMAAAQINESHSVYHAKKAQPSQQRESYHVSSNTMKQSNNQMALAGASSRGAAFPPSTAPGSKPPRSSSQHVNQRRGAAAAANHPNHRENRHEKAAAASQTSSNHHNNNNNSRKLTLSRSQERISSSQYQEGASSLHLLISPGGGSNSRRLAIPQTSIQIHQIPESIVERKSINNLNEKSHLQLAAQNERF